MKERIDESAPTIQRRAGHDNIQMTLGYVKMAEDLTGKVGTPFAPIPFAPMLGGGSGCWTASGPSAGQVAAIRSETAENTVEDQLPMHPARRTRESGQS